MRWLKLHEYVHVNGRPVEPEEMRRYADELARQRRAEAERRGEKQEQRDRRRSS